MCWIAPLMPHAMYRSGAIRVPVWPTCWACGRQPAEVTTRETPTVPPSSAASSSSCGETLGAPDAAAATDHDTRVGQRDRPLLGRDVRGDPDAKVAVGQVRGERLDRGRRAGAGGGRRERMRRDRQQADRTVEPSLLEQAPAPALAGDLPRFAGADLGDSSRPAARPSRAAAWARISAPRSLPVPITAAGDSRSISWARARPSASGA